MDSLLRIGTAGWTIPRGVAARFGAEGSGLARYAQALSCAEINSTFYRPHRATTYARWAATTPANFAFSVKVPKRVTHELRLCGAEAALAQFFEEIAVLGDKLGPVLIQLPPSLAFDEAAMAFVQRWRSLYAGPTACEPRHASWFTEVAEALLAEAEIARVAADPAVVAHAAEPGGWRGLTYLRLHGSPRMYASSYGSEALAAAARVLCDRPAGTEGWCVFDNTLSGAAAENALDLAALLAAARS